MGMMITPPTKRRRKSYAKVYVDAFVAAMRWSSLMTYPRELGQGEAREAANAWCRYVGLNGRDRIMIHYYFVKCANARLEKLSIGQEVYA